MTEKRFKGFYVEEKGWGISDTNTKIDWLIETKGDLIEFLKLLNSLNDENEQLKQFKDNTFVLINEMIETANLYRTPIKSLDYGDDLGYWNGVYQKLKELRDILENEQTRK